MTNDSSSTGSSTGRPLRVDPGLFPEQGTPGVDHCVAHGRPAARRVDMALRSRPAAKVPLWRRLNVLALAGEAGHHAQQAKVVKVYSWPLCSRCARRRVAWFNLFLLLLVGGVLTITVTATLRNLGGIAIPAAPAVAVAGVVAALASTVPFTLGGLARITSARADDTGSVIIVDTPSRAFVADAARHTDKLAGPTS